MAIEINFSIALLLLMSLAAVSIWFYRFSTRLPQGIRSDLRWMNIYMRRVLDKLKNKPAANHDYENELKEIRKLMAGVFFLKDRIMSKRLKPVDGAGFDVWYDHITSLCDHLKEAGELLTPPLPTDSTDRNDRISEAWVSLGDAKWEKEKLEGIFESYLEQLKGRDGIPRPGTEVLLLTEFLDLLADANRCLTEAIAELVDKNGDVIENGDINHVREIIQKIEANKINIFDHFPPFYGQTFWLWINTLHELDKWLDEFFYFEYSNQPTPEEREKLKEIIEKAKAVKEKMHQW